MGRPKSSEGVFSITSPGITERVSASAPSLGAAFSKAQNIAYGLQCELKKNPDEADVTISIRRLGSETLLGRVIVQRELIATASFA